MRTTTSLAVLALSASFALAGCGSNAPQTTAADPIGSSGAAPTDPGTPASPTDSPTTSDPATPPTSSAPSAPGAGAVPVYFVGDTPGGSRLFREFRDVAGTDADARMTAAAAMLTTGKTLDPDYRTLLPAGIEVTGVTIDAGTIVVEVSPDSPTSADKSVSPDDAALAVQQLVYTLQGAGQTRDPVRVVQGDGTSSVPVPLLGVDTTKGVKARPPLAVLGLVNVTEPAQGATVTGTLAASGVASSFEANVPWEIRAGGAKGAVVQSGSATATGYLHKLYPWSVSVDVSALPAGPYTFVASTDDPSGKEGTGPTSDTKAFTVG